MSTYTTTVAIPVTIEAPDLETAIKLADTAADTARTGITSQYEVTAGDLRIDRLTRAYTREQAAIDAVRAALTATLVPHTYTRTVPHLRQIRDHGLKAGVTLTDSEIHNAVKTVMSR